MNNIRTLDDIPTRHNVMVLTQIALIKTLLCFTCTTTKICSTKDCFHDFFHLNVKTPTVYTLIPTNSIITTPRCQMSCKDGWPATKYSSRKLQKKYDSFV